MQNITTGDLKKFKQVAEVTNPRVLGSDSVWHLVISMKGQFGADDYQIVTDQKETPQAFRSANAAIKYLLKLGIDGPCSIDYSHYDPSADKKPKRPAQSERMKETYKKATDTLLTDENGNCLSCGKPAVDHTHDHCRTEGIEKSVPES